MLAWLTVSGTPGAGEVSFQNRFVIVSIQVVLPMSEMFSNGHTKSVLFVEKMKGSDFNDSTKLAMRSRAWELRVLWEVGRVERRDFQLTAASTIREGTLPLEDLFEIRDNGIWDTKGM